MLSNLLLFYLVIKVVEEHNLQELTGYESFPITFGILLIFMYGMRQLATKTHSQK